MNTQPALSPCSQVSEDELPEQLRSTPEQIAQDAWDAGVSPEEYAPMVTVRSSAGVDDLQRQAMRSLLALETLQGTLTACKQHNTPITATAAKAITVSLEHCGFAIRMPSKEAFDQGSPAVASYAVEAVQEASDSVFKKIWEYIKKLFQQLMLRIKAYRQRARQSYTKLERLKKFNTGDYDFKVDKDHWPARDLLSYKDITNRTAMLTSIPEGLSVMIKNNTIAEDLPANLNARTYMPLYSSNVMDNFNDQLKEQGYEFNPLQLGGYQWSIKPSTERVPGTDAPVAFYFERDNVDREVEVRGVIPGATMVKIVSLLEKMLLSETQTLKNIETYWSSFKEPAGAGEETAQTYRTILSAVDAIRKHIECYSIFAANAVDDVVRAHKHNTTFK